MYDVLPQTDTLHLRYTISLGKLVVNTSDDRPNQGEESRGLDLLELRTGRLS